MAHLSSSSEVPVVVGRVRRKGCLRRMLFLVSTGPSAQALDAGRRRKLLPAHTAPAHGQWIGGVRSVRMGPDGPLGVHLTKLPNLASYSLHASILHVLQKILQHLSHRTETRLPNPKAQCIIALGNWKSLKSNNVFMKSMVPGSSSRRGAVLLGGSSSIQA
eukprot:scaffold56342_cov19-Tisochrysis_lutea.AAC.1